MADEEDVQFVSPHKYIYQEYIYKRDNSQKGPAEHKQKILQNLKDKKNTFTTGKMKERKKKKRNKKDEDPGKVCGRSPGTIEATHCY